MLRQFMVWAIAVLALAAAGAASVGLARRPVPLARRLDVRWLPPQPLQGTLVRVTVFDTAARGAERDSLAARLAGEPLHFEPDGAGGLAALAAVPLNAADTLRLALMRSGGPARDTLFVAIPVTRRPVEVEKERLRTAPRFTAPPDAALAARIAAEQRLVAAVLEGTHRRQRLWHEPFLRPRDTRVTSPFGQSREFNADTVVRRHSGADLAGRRGTPVRAANRGVAALVADLYYAGTAVFLDHGAGLATAYLHLQRALVAQGDTVTRGQVIGHVGSSGRVTGPHLHWSAHYGRLAFDPLGLLELPAAAVEATAPPGGTAR